MAQQHEAGKWRVDDTHDDAPVSEPMNGKGAKPSDRKRPDADQKKVRRQMAHASAYTPEVFAAAVIAQFEEAEAERNLRLSPPAKSWNINGADSSRDGTGSNDAAGSSDGGGSSSGGSHSSSSAMKKGAPFAGYDDFEDCTAENLDKRDPEAYCGEIKHRTEDKTASIDRAGDRECESCGTVGAPTLGDTGPTCPACGSYSLKASPVSRARQKAATRMETNVATSDGSRMLIVPGDQIKTPTGQALTIKNVRRHETSRDHYYVDTDQGTTLVPWNTNFTLVPNNQSQQVLPGSGVPGGNFNTVPGIEEDGSAGAPSVCPGCGGKGTLNRQGQAFKCSRCGFTDKNVGGDMNFSDARQQIRSSRTAGVITQRALSVLAQEEEIQS